MPLIQGKSKKSFEHNMKAEMQSGKPQKQSLAIAFSIKRKNGKKMADGGVVSQPIQPQTQTEQFQEAVRKKFQLDGAQPKAKGGMIHDDSDEHYESIADAILAKKKKAKMMADGGMVDLDENGMEEPNSFYDENEDAALKENYDEDMDSLRQPEDSNEFGDDLEDEDKHDMISKLRAKVRAKRGL